MGNFDVIVAKKPRYPRSFVHHDIYSKIKLNALKFRDHNIMSTLQSSTVSLLIVKPVSVSSNM